MPTNVQSFSVEALNRDGNLIAGPSVSNRPDFQLSIVVSNGEGIELHVKAFENSDAQGNVIYEGKRTVDLKGIPVAVPVVELSHSSNSKCG